MTLRHARHVLLRAKPSGELVDDLSLDMLNFETDPSRALLEVILTEFLSLRSELESISRDIESTYQYFLALTGAIVASQLVDSSQLQKLLENPLLLSLIALVSLWFPVNYMLLHMRSSAIRHYLRTVTQEKLNHIVYQMSIGSQPSFQYYEWVQEAMLNGMREPAAWENARLIYGSGREGADSWARHLVWAFRLGILYAPYAVITYQALWLGFRSYRAAPIAANPIMWAGTTLGGLGLSAATLLLAWKQMNSGRSIRRELLNAQASEPQ